MKNNIVNATDTYAIHETKCCYYIMNPKQTINWVIIILFIEIKTKKLSWKFSKKKNSQEFDNAVRDNRFNSLIYLISYGKLGFIYHWVLFIYQMNKTWSVFTWILY